MSDSEDEEVQSKTVKITVVGEPSTGKSSLCSRYLGGAAAVTGGSTQGAEVMAGQCVGLRLPAPLQLCDVAGNALETSMLGNYLYASDIVLFVYDLTNLQSFEKLSLWMTKIKRLFETEMKKPLMALFGNKSDLEHQRAVRLSAVLRFASEHLLESFKGSARTGDMVNVAFTSLVARALGLKIRKLPQLTPNGKSPPPREPDKSKNSEARDDASTHSLIMNRRALRKFHRRASSTVCVLQ